MWIEELQKHASLMVVLTMCIEELKNTYVTDGQVDNVY